LQIIFKNLSKNNDDIAELLENLQQFEKYKGYLEKNKKKDDLADCFLQGIYYLTLKNMINIEL